MKRYIAVIEITDDEIGAQGEHAPLLDSFDLRRSFADEHFSPRDVGIRMEVLRFAEVLES